MKLPIIFLVTFNFKLQVECKQIMAQSHVVERPASLCNSPRPIDTKACNSRPCLLDTSTPEIGLANSSYIQHDPKKKKVSMKDFSQKKNMTIE